MTTWTELRTVALVGTERRALPEAPADTGGPSGVVPELPAHLSIEQRALSLAAMLGAARRASIRPGSATAPVSPAPTSEEKIAPAEAVQLLELILGGNASPGKLDDILLERWFHRCREGTMVVPHRLLVEVLEHASAREQLRDHVTPTLGDRGRWLAQQRQRWSWATGAATPSTAITRSIEELMAMPADQRSATLVAIRAHDPSRGRELVAQITADAPAATRAKTIACLEPHLDDADEDLLEAALDDRSKAVRDHAIRMLNQLPGSARARRLARRLEPLVTMSGRLRRTIEVAYPAPPTDEEARDLPSTGSGVVEQQWFDALVGGAPLDWWQGHLQLSADKIVAAKLEPADELLTAWTVAARAQRNTAWAAALHARTNDAGLLTLAGASTAERAFADAIGRKDANPVHQARALAAIDGPWSESFSRTVVRWLVDGAGTRTFTPAMAANLSAAVLPDLEVAFARHRGADDQAAARTIRNAIHHLSFRTSIDRAFAHD